MAEKDPDVAHEVLRSIRQIVRRISEHSKYLSSEAGLTVPQLMCLKAIGEIDERGRDAEITVAMVGKSVTLSAATVSRIVDRLVTAGLVARERRAVDRRKVCLSLTAAGLERYQTLPTPLQETFVARFKALEPGERDHLLSALRRISSLMDATDLDAAPLLVLGEDIKQADGEG
ncbi:MAG: MarR family transcriptional regulator [Polyangiaceae bacterium]